MFVPLLTSEIKCITLEITELWSEGGFLKLYETRFTSLHLHSTQLLFDSEINNFSNVYSLFLRTT